MSSFPDSWSVAQVPFGQEHPVWMREGPHPGSPLVVLCHGMSQTPQSWLDAAPRILSLPVHVLLPAGPFPHEVRTGDTIRIGHAWYLYDGGPERFRETLDRSEAWLRDCIRIAESARGWVPSSRVLLGHSQGAYFAYVAALRRPETFSHLVAVAGRLKEEFLETELARGGSLRTLIVHGQRDSHVPPQAARASYDALRRAGFPAEHLEVAGGHGFTPEVDAACAGWIAARVEAG